MSWKPSAEEWDERKKDGVTINGDLIVKGTLTFDGGNAQSVGGTIYCDRISGVSNSAVSNVVKEGYVEHVNELVPGYAQIPYSRLCP